MGKQIGQLRKVTPLLPVNSATRTSSWPWWSHARLTGSSGPLADPIRARRGPSSRHSLATCEVLRGLPYPAARSACPPRRANAFGARASNDDDLVFDSRHEVSTFHFHGVPGYSFRRSSARVSIFPTPRNLGPKFLIGSGGIHANRHSRCGTNRIGFENTAPRGLRPP